MYPYIHYHTMCPSEIETERVESFSDEKLKNKIWNDNDDGIWKQHDHECNFNWDVAARSSWPNARKLHMRNFTFLCVSLGSFHCNDLQESQLILLRYKFT